MTSNLSLTLSQSIWKDIVRIRSHIPCIYAFAEENHFKRIPNTLSALGVFSLTTASLRNPCEIIIDTADVLVVNIEQLNGQDIQRLHKVLQRAKQQFLPLTINTPLHALTVMELVGEFVSLRPYWKEVSDVCY